jgi:glycerol-3-phosphate dehydrogenase
VDGFEELVRQTSARYQFLAQPTVRRLVRGYGTRVEAILAGATAQADLGRNFGADLTEAEVRYLAREEWAMTADDIVWRRTKLGLRMSKSEILEVEAYLGATQASLQTVE